MIKNYVEIIKQSVSMREVCERYGIEISKINKALCPFHADTHASMHIYKDSFYCFTCNTSGDIIAFIELYFNLNFQDAIHKLDEDFQLNLFNSKKTKKQKKQIAKEIRRKIEIKQTYDDFINWKEQTSNLISQSLRIGNLAFNKPINTWNEAEILSIKYNPYLQYIFEKINSSNIQEQIEILRTEQRQGVTELCKKILRSVPMK